MYLCKRNIFTHHAQVLRTLAGFLLLASLGNAQPKQSLLSGAFPPQKLKDVLISRQDWHPIPTHDEREPWQALPEEVRQRLIARGEEGLNYRWPALPATLFLEYVRIGNRRNYEKERSSRRDMLCHLVIAECVEGKGRFMDDIVNGIWTICEESYWGVPAHLGMQKAGHGLPDVTEPTVDLFAGETASLLAWTCYLLGPQLDNVSPRIRQRAQHELQVRVLTPCLERDDFWWMGFTERRVNNWNPWCNSNWLTTVLLVETDEARRLAAVEKIMRSLDQFIGSYPPDGGCDEGPGYWNRAGASLFDCLELLHSATHGAIDLYNEPLIREIGRYIYRVHIADRYFINFADASAIVNPAADLTYRYGRRIGDTRLQAFGAYAASHGADGSEISGSIGRQLPAIFNLSALQAAKAAPPLLRDVWLPDIQVMATRSQEGSTTGLYVAAKGGHNNESHNHNDVGNFIVYMDGRPMIIDVGVETYTAKTFSSKRYEIWTMQSAYHNLPTINGVMQQAGQQYAAKAVVYHADAGSASLQLDISNAYPPEAGLKSWVRTVRLNRRKNLVVEDAYELAKTAQPIILSLMTPCEVEAEGAGQFILRDSSTSVRLRFNAEKLAATTETISLEDERLKSVWGDRLTRILLRTNAPALKDRLTLRLVP